MHRSVYASWTLCGPLCEGTISLSRRSRVMFAATVTEPGIGFAEASRASYGATVAFNASKERLAATWASFRRNRPSRTAKHASAPMTDVPLISARPSFDSSSRGGSPARRRAGTPARTRPPTPASPPPRGAGGGWEVWAGSQGALRGDDRMDAAVQEVEEPLYDLHANPRKPSREGVRAQ